MNKNQIRESRKIKRLFTDAIVVDFLNLAKKTTYWYYLPNIEVYIDESYQYGYVAIENIANFDILNKANYEQQISSVLSRKYSRYAVTSSELTDDHMYMLYRFEDVAINSRFFISDNLQEFVCKNKNKIQLSSNLVWDCVSTPHMSIIARTRAGKSYLAGEYLAPIMMLQGWRVEYNSSKYDMYVKKYNGVSESEDIVQRAEYYVSVMEERLKIINDNNAEKYTDINNMNNIGLFFDEIGNLNASLENDKNLKSRWTNAINKLTATGGSAGIHVIAILQFATKESFLPSLARVNCSDFVIMLGAAADSGDERRYLMSGFADLSKKNYNVGEGLVKSTTSGKMWEKPHFYQCPYIIK